MRELMRIFSSPKTIAVLILLCVMNLALFAGFCRTQEEQNVYTEDIRAEETRIYLESGYEEYLSYVSKQSSGQSILSALGKQSDFIKRNRQQTAKDYAALQGITLQSGEDDGVNALLAYTVTDYLLLIAPLLLVMEILTAQRSACGALIRSTKKGRVPLLLWRMLALLIVSAVSVALLWGGNAVYGGIFFGDPVLSRAVQSVPAFQHCVFPISVGEFFLFCGLLKTAAVFCIALIVWLILSVCQPVLAAILLAVVFGAQWLCYVLFDATSALNHLKYCNLFAPLEGCFFFSDYNNLNWFGHPLGMLMSSGIALALMLLAGFILLIVLVGIAHPFQVGARVQQYTERIQKWCSVRFGCHSVFLYEGKKLLIAQRGLLVIIVAAAMGVSFWKDTRMYIPYPSYWNEIYEEYGGDVTEEKMLQFENHIKELEDHVVWCEGSLQKTIDDELPEYWVWQAESKLKEAEDKLAFYEKAYLHMQELDAYRTETGNPIWLIQEDGYNALIQGNAAAERSMLLLLLYVIFLCSGLGAYENRFGAVPLLRSTKQGRWGRNGCKILWVLLLVIPATLAIHGVYYHMVAQIVPLNVSEAPVQSLAILRFIPFSMSIGTFIVLWMTARVLLALVFAGASAWLGSKCRTPQNALLLCLMIFFMPTALAETGISILQPLDFAHHLGLFVG